MVHPSLGSVSTHLYVLSEAETPPLPDDNLLNLCLLKPCCVMEILFFSKSIDGTRGSAAVHLQNAA